MTDFEAGAVLISFVVIMLAIAWVADMPNDPVSPYEEEDDDE